MDACSLRSNVTTSRRSPGPPCGTGIVVNRLPAARRRKDETAAFLREFPGGRPLRARRGRGHRAVLDVEKSGQRLHRHDLAGLADRTDRRSARHTPTATALTRCSGERLAAALRDCRSALPSVEIMSGPVRGKVEKRPRKSFRVGNPELRLTGVVARDAVLDLPEATAGPFFVRPDRAPLVQFRPLQGMQRNGVFSVSWRSCQVIPMAKSIPHRRGRFVRSPAPSWLDPAPARLLQQGITQSRRNHVQTVQIRQSCRLQSSIGEP